MTTRHLII